MMNKETEQYIKEHAGEDVKMLALRSVPQGVDRTMALQQIEGLQRARTKLPLWANTPGVIFPVRLSMEQCSGEETARYKASLVERLLPEDRREVLVDLTAGFGVDFTLLSQSFQRAVYVERNEALCEIARNNMPLLTPDCRVEVLQGDGTEYLQRMERANLLFLDPARRDVHGAKVVAIADCEPDVEALEEALVARADVVMIKLSPMLDIRPVLNTLNYVREIHVVAAGGECKELLVILRKEPEEEPVTIYAVNGEQRIAFTHEEESAATVTFADVPETYLYEPNAAVMKAAAYKWVAARYGVKKLHPDSHLYTSDCLVQDFPGRVFRVEGFSGFGKKEVKGLLPGVTKANIAVRNFPISVAELRKKLKLQEGGEVYLFGTTAYDKRHLLIRCSKV